MDVAAAFGRVWAMPPQAAEWAREIHCGDLEGRPLDQMRRELPEIWAPNEAQADDTAPAPSCSEPGWIGQYGEVILNAPARPLLADASQWSSLKQT